MAAVFSNHHITHELVSLKLEILFHFSPYVFGNGLSQASSRLRVVWQAVEEEFEASVTILLGLVAAEFGTFPWLHSEGVLIFHNAWLVSASGEGLSEVGKAALEHHNGPEVGHRADASRTAAPRGFRTGSDRRVTIATTDGDLRPLGDARRAISVFTRSRLQHWTERRREEARGGERRREEVRGGERR